MTKTEFLFGHPKEKYYGTSFPQVGYDRISDAKIVLKKLHGRVSYDPTKQNKFQTYLSYRIGEVSDAIKTWEKILEIEGI